MRERVALLSGDEKLHAVDGVERGQRFNDRVDHRAFLRSVSGRERFCAEIDARAPAGNIQLIARARRSDGQQAERRGFHIIGKARGKQAQRGTGDTLLLRHFHRHGNEIAVAVLVIDGRLLRGGLRGERRGYLLGRFGIGHLHHRHFRAARREKEHERRRPSDHQPLQMLPPQLELYGLNAHRITPFLQLHMTRGGGK